MIIGGQSDGLCPVAMSKTLYTSAINSKGRQIMIVPNGEHNNTFIVAGDEYITHLRQFIKTSLGETEKENSDDLLHVSIDEQKT